MIRKLVCSLIVVMLAACAAQNGDELSGKPENRNWGPIPSSGSLEDVKRLHSELLKSTAFALPGVRERTYAPENVLPKLHAWFGTDDSHDFKAVGPYFVLFLRDLPDSVLADLERATFPDAFNSGIAILQARFWRQVKATFKAGLSVGFVISKNPVPKAGFYVAQARIIVVDIFANIGVLDHELRHHQQSLALRKRKAVPPITMRADCVRGTSVFFSELDATSVELPTWHGVFQTVEVTPEWHRNGSGLEDGPFPQIDSLSANLRYPGKIFHYPFSSAGCPPELKDAMSTIAKETDETAEAIHARRAEKLFTLRRDHYTAWTTIHRHFGLPNYLREKLADERTMADIEAIPKEAIRLKNEIDAELDAALPRRRKVVQDALKNLPDGIHDDLCRSALGYEFLYDCSRFVEK